MPLNKLNSVALVGRRNVGKSSLVNLLSKSRYAITDDTPGLTRDILEIKIQYEDLEFILYDTPGLDLEETEELNKKINARTKKFLLRVDLIIFVFSAPHPTVFDLQFMEFIRKQIHHKPILYVVNKVDNPDNATDTLIPFHEAHLQNLIPISTYGRWNISLLIREIRNKLMQGGDAEKIETISKNLEEKSSHNVLPQEEEEEIKHLSVRKKLKFLNEKNKEKNIEEKNLQESVTTLSLVGKPNAGKSSLFNRFINGPTSSGNNGGDIDFERALVSDIPGTTRDSIDTIIQHNGSTIKIIDTAGLRRPTHLNSEKYKIEFYSTTRTEQAIKNSTVVVLVVDALVGLTDFDKRICSMIQKHGRAVIFAVSKWDALKSQKQKEDSAVKTEEDYVHVYKDRLDFLFPHIRHLPLIFCSAHTGQGISRILAKAIELNKLMYIKLTTSNLNQYLKSWCEHQPVNSRKVKIKYITQIATSPPTFSFFVNEPKLFKAPLESYFENCIRKQFELKGVPIVIKVRASSD